MLRSSKVLKLSALIFSTFFCTFLFAQNTDFKTVTTLANSGVTKGDGISVNTNGDVFISGGENGTIQKITKDGEVSEFASGFKSLNGSDFDSKGNLYVSAYANNQIIKFTPDGNHTVFVDNLDGPAGLVIDKNDNVIISLYGKDFSGTGATVLQFSPKGEKTVVATGQGLKDVIGVAIDEKGIIYAGNYHDKKVFSIQDEVATYIARAEVSVNQIDYFDGMIYIAGETFISYLTPDGKSDIFAGGYNLGATNGTLEEARFLKPNCVAFNDDHSIMYVYDSYTGDVRLISK